MLAKRQNFKYEESCFIAHLLIKSLKPIMFVTSLDVSNTMYCQTIDSLLVEWKLTVLFIFHRGTLAQKYID